MKKTHVVGLLLWRSGLLLAGSYTAVRAARWVLRFVDLPVQIEVGLGLVLAGAVLVLASLLERVT